MKRLLLAAGVIASLALPFGAEPLRAGAAIRQQLGLRLERTRAQDEVLVIDRVERPTDN